MSVNLISVFRRYFGLALLISLLALIPFRSAWGMKTGSASLPSKDSKVALGRALYFDKRLSVDGTISCATCHDPAAAFAGKQTLPIGVSNRVGTRNAPSILNSRFNKSYFWDGRANSLEEQAKQPLLNSTEMGMQSEAALVARLASIAEYRSYFRKVFPRDAITLDTVARAIA